VTDSGEEGIQTHRRRFAFKGATSHPLVAELVTAHRHGVQNIVDASALVGVAGRAAIQRPKVQPPQMRQTGEAVGQIQGFHERPQGSPATQTEGEMLHLLQPIQ
jgi:hypothetical protein